MLSVLRREMRYHESEMTRKCQYAISFTISAYQPHLSWFSIKWWAKVTNHSYVLFIVCIFQDRGFFLYSPRCLETPTVDQAGLKIRDPASAILPGSKVCATIAWLQFLIHNWSKIIIQDQVFSLSIYMILNQFWCCSYTLYKILYTLIYENVRGWWVPNSPCLYMLLLQIKLPTSLIAGGFFLVLRKLQVCSSCYQLMSASGIETNFHISLVKCN